MASEAQEISEAVAYWLHHKSLTGLKGLLNEASMAVPIAEYLSSRYGKEVKSEEAHPLWNGAGRGRPKQIDFVRIRGGQETWHAAYECKFQNQDFDRIIADIGRLVCLAQARESIGNCDRYFIFSAKREANSRLLGKYFNTGQGIRMSYFDPILSRDAAKGLGLRTRFRINELHEKQIKSFRKFSKEYKVKLPSTIVTELLGWSTTSRFVCAVWRITSARGANLIGYEEMSA